MKRLFIVFTALLFASLFAFAKDLKILTIGNSFVVSVFKDFPEIVKDFPDCTLTLESANHGGCSFSRHWKYITEEEADANVSCYNKSTITQGYCSIQPTKASKKRGCNRLSEILESKKWDFITIQQVSSESLFRETFYPYAENIYKYINKHAPSAEVVIQQTWSYRCDDPRFLPTKTWGKDGINQTEMFKRAEANYAELAKKLNLRVIPTGKAVQNYRAVEKNPFKPYSKEYLATFKQPNVPSNDGDIVGKHRWRENKKTKEIELSADHIHFNSRGEYMQSCLFFGFFFEKDPLEIKYVPKEISADEAKLLREVASKTLKEFKQPRDLK
jgi:hypothetical protein